MHGTPHAGGTDDAFAITDVWDASVVVGPPEAPLDLNASVASSTEIDLGWRDNSSDEAEFVIDRATDPDFMQNLVTDAVGTNVTEFRASGLDPLANYYFRVRARNAEGDSPLSNIASEVLGNVVRLDNASTDDISGSGNWWRSTAVGGYHSIDYYQDGNTGKGKKFRFTPHTVTVGTYEVFLRWSSDPNRAARVPVDITSLAGTDTVKVNQRLEGGHWVSLGRFNFDPAISAPMVTIRTAGTAGYVIADAVKFVQAEADPALSIPKKTTRKLPAAFKNNLQIKTILATGKRIPAISDVPRRNRSSLRGVFNTAGLIQSMGIASDGATLATVP
jgi:hypothetical protein